jgi:hypothetical protein
MKTLTKFVLACVAVCITNLASVSTADAAEVPSQAELDQMLAPVALYPDVLLSQVLMASTYPLEVVEASRWLQGQTGLEGEEAVEAAADMDWDDSVKALTAFPDLLKRMDENITWMRRLGDAFLSQEEQVMETIQQLRQKALDEGSLDSLAHLEVEETTEGIVIEPVETRIIYVPWYSTRIVYGDWWWPSYPPVCWYTPYPYYGGVSFYWGTGFRFSTGFHYSSCDWHRRKVVVWRPSHYHRYNSHRPEQHRRHVRDADVWRHDPYHRRRVDYRNEHTDNRYAHSSRPRPETRPERPRREGTRTGSTGAQLEARQRPNNQDRTSRPNVAVRPPGRSSPQHASPAAKPPAPPARVKPAPPPVAAKPVSPPARQPSRNWDKQHSVATSKPQGRPASSRPSRQPTRPREP